MSGRRAKADRRAAVRAAQEARARLAAATPHVLLSRPGDTPARAFRGRWGRGG